jgi:lipoate-protein ligase A
VRNIDIRVAQPGPDRAYRTDDDVVTTVSTAFTNRRQENVFRRMFGGGQPDNVYHDGKNWTWCAPQSSRTPDWGRPP